MEMAREKALAKPGADADQVDKGMEFFSKNYTLFIVLGLVFWYLLVGAISSLVGAAVPKKNPQSSLENQFK
ncbi:MAG: hypothetical protein JST13_06745, partial [Bacteroidetes bacterium]|nr:hypothetical protein [Bacteroidota bacterium]